MVPLHPRLVEYGLVGLMVLVSVTLYVVVLDLLQLQSTSLPLERQVGIVVAMVLVACHELLGLPSIPRLIRQAAGISGGTPATAATEEPVRTAPIQRGIVVKAPVAADAATAITTTATPAQTTLVRPKVVTLDDHPEAAALVAQFTRLADVQTYPATPDGKGTEWQLVLTQERAPIFSVQVHKRVGTDFCFRVVASLQGTPAEAFDLLSDIRRRVEYDPVCEECRRPRVHGVGAPSAAHHHISHTAGIVKKVDNMCSINYFRTRGFWPTASRDALVKSFVVPLPGEQRFLNVTSSIDAHSAYTSRSGDVRMLARIAGQLVERDPQGRPGVCRVIQVMDGDLCGWIPQAVVSMITTQAFPVAMRKVDKLLRSLPTQRTTSALVEEAAGRLIPEGTETTGATVNIAEASRDVVNSVPVGVDEEKNDVVAAAAGPAPAGAPIRSQPAWWALLSRYLHAAQPWLVAVLFLRLALKVSKRRFMGS
jgi:hypothetical protein